jgi:hypothetical protein
MHFIGTEMGHGGIPAVGLDWDSPAIRAEAGSAAKLRVAALHPRRFSVKASVSHLR